MKKILTVTHSFPDDFHPARGIFILDEIKLLEHSASFTIAVVNTFFNRIKLNHKVFTPNIDIKKLSYFSLPFKYFKIKKGYYISKKLKNLSRYKDFDIIHSHFLIPAGLSVSYLDKPTVITIHGSDWNIHKDDYIWFPVLKDSLKKASAIITVSNSLKKDILGYIPELEKKIYSIPHSINPFWLESSLKKNSPSEPINIVTVASLTPIKGVLFLVMALNEIRTEKKIVLKIFSIQKNQEYFSKVNKIVENLPENISVKIQNESSRNELRDAYENADFSVLPSLKEGFGLSIIEANACGVPVISTRSGGPETIIEEVNGMLTEPGDSASLALTIDKMIHSLDQFDRKKIRQHVIKKFSPEIKKNKILEVYNDITD
ncbi:hypothetical protein A8B79_14145 [Balneola sp. EhC07]|jgi:glycosyltransferase involved in cell wall biosynthesis|uniref:glycosyltransferase family 4 protein n=1 Tax=Balneola sp. EhC07 TaxID=1849360 RepID=UPI0007F45309|nr:glycosyltransferase family 4 protein [Balneola sp. EhC07]OAN64131.1 hypothetical protein A8B79_14145 [Balneola sp. EhC07]